LANFPVPSLSPRPRLTAYEVTVHGFRSTFRDWAGEETNYPNELCEMALAHTIKNKAEAAYRRGAMVERRRHLMQDWQNYLETKSSTAKVTSINRRSKG